MASDAEILKAIFRYGARTKTINVPAGAVEPIYDELLDHFGDNRPDLYEDYFEVVTNYGDTIRVQGI